MARLALIAAVARNGIIGKDGALPWRIPEDMRHFKQTTTGHAIIMGRKTYDEFKKPLPNRRNLVVSRQPGLELAGCEVVSNLDEAIARAQAGDSEPFIIGGAEIYRLALPRVTHMYLTYVDRDAEGDVRFPEYDRGAFREVARRVGETEGVTFVTLERISG